MLFAPKNYSSIEELQTSFIQSDAHSDTSIEGKDIFGFVGDEAYEAVEVYCPIAEEYYWVAGPKV